jgi:signal-transduction protein with cAMP-binding, CBS, and nucleotidyltransferase domain
MVETPPTAAIRPTVSSCPADERRKGAAPASSDHVSGQINEEQERLQMANPLTMKLEQFTQFGQEERRRFDDLLRYPTKTYERGEAIIREGEKVRDIHLVLTGLAARAKTLPDGDRQIMAFLVPGDLFDVEVFVLEVMDHEIKAMGDTS